MDKTNLYKTPEDRYWSKVDKSSPDACWIWTGSIGGPGYGTFKVGKDHYVNAHRFSWEITHGRIPNGLCVCHKCDNRACVNPAHLFLGTIADNNRDMVSKGRQPKGEKSGPSKLSGSQVIEIRAKYRSGDYSYRKLAAEYPVNWSAIRSVVKGRTWREK